MRRPPDPPFDHLKAFANPDTADEWFKEYDPEGVVFGVSGYRMTKLGIDIDGIAQTEANHFMKCPTCRQWFDMRDLDQVLAHVHDAEIEISEGPEPSLREGPSQ